MPLARPTRRQILTGTAGAIACATLVPARVDAAYPSIRIPDLYDGTDFSPRADALTGQRIIVSGYMAPPLKADAAFFVLTKIPMATCPFCSSVADWPADIIFVRLRRFQGWVRFNVPIEVLGILEIGPATDPDTGFVSMVRLTDAQYRPKGWTPS